MLTNKRQDSTPSTPSPHPTLIQADHNLSILKCDTCTCYSSVQLALERRDEDGLQVYM